MTTKRAVWCCCAALACALLGAGPTHAAEYDPYWGWHAPPRDATVRMNRSLNALLVQGLSDVNAARPATCREAARILTAPLVVTSKHFFRSGMRHWTMDRSPRDERGRKLFDEVSVYRDTPLFPLGHFVPLDPTLQAGDVLFGPDKIGHFFTNGLRSWGLMLDRRAAGASEEEAFVEAMRYGVVEEKGLLGFGIDGVFSFADLHAMSAGVRFFSALCGTENQPARLMRGDDGRWSLAELFRIEEHLDPCWDESFTPSAFTEREGDNVARALVEVCPLLDDAAVRARRARYGRRGCHAPTQAALDRLIASKEAPDPSRWDIARVCAPSSASTSLVGG